MVRKLLQKCRSLATRAFQGSRSLVVRIPWKYVAVIFITSGVVSTLILGTLTIREQAKHIRKLGGAQVKLMGLASLQADRMSSQESKLDLFTQALLDINLRTNETQAQIDILDASIDPTKKRWALVKKTRDIIIEKIPKWNPISKCDGLSPGYVLRVAGYMVDYSEKYGVPLALSLAVGRRESIYCQKAVSSAGAMGIMQLMGPTADELAHKIGASLKRYRARDNVRMGIYYLAELSLDFEGNTELAVKAYNAGPTHVRRVEAGEVSQYYTETAEYWVAVEKYQKEFEELGL